MSRYISYESKDGKSGFSIIFKWSFRHRFPKGSRKLPLFGSRTKKRFVLSLGDRIKAPVRYKMVWFPFVVYIGHTILPRSFKIYKDDNLNVKCLIEYEHLKETGKSFDILGFTQYMKTKYGFDPDEVEYFCKGYAVARGSKHISSN